MARPKTGETPARVRQADALQRLRDAGGDRIYANLPAASIAHLEAVMTARGLTERTQGLMVALEIAAAAVKR